MMFKICCKYSSKDNNKKRLEGGTDETRAAKCWKLLKLVDGYVEVHWAVLVYVNLKMP